MSLFPPCPVNLGELILANCENGRLEHLSFSRLPGGRFQASFRRPDTNGYKVHIADTPTEALERVLGPDYGHDWSEILGPAFVKPMYSLDDEDEDLGDLV